MESKGLQRIRRSKAEWRGVFERYAETKMSAIEFCRTEGISVASFHKWRRRLSALAPAPSFIELQPERLRGSHVRAELDLGQGMVFRIFG